MSERKLEERSRGWRGEMRGSCSASIHPRLRSAVTAVLLHLTASDKHSGGRNLPASVACCLRRCGGWMAGTPCIAFLSLQPAWSRVDGVLLSTVCVHTPASRGLVSKECVSFSAHFHPIPASDVCSLAACDDNSDGSDIPKDFFPSNFVRSSSQPKALFIWTT